MPTLSTNYATCEQRRVSVPPLQGEFPRVLQIYVSFFSKIAPLASGVRLKTRFGEALVLWLTVICIVETWLDIDILDSEICIQGYCLCRLDRTRHGGGVLIYVNNMFTHTVLFKGTPDCELLIVSIHSNVVMVVYCMFS